MIYNSVSFVFAPSWLWLCSSDPASLGSMSTSPFAPPVLLECCLQKEAKRFNVRADQLFSHLLQLNMAVPLMALPSDLQCALPTSSWQALLAPTAFPLFQLFIMLPVYLLQNLSLNYWTWSFFISVLDLIPLCLLPGPHSTQHLICQISLLACNLQGSSEIAHILDLLALFLTIPHFNYKTAWSNSKQSEPCQISHSDKCSHFLGWLNNLLCFFGGGGMPHLHNCKAHNSLMIPFVWLHSIFTFAFCWPPAICLKGRM